MWLSALVLAVFAVHTGLLLRYGAFMGPIIVSPAFFTALFLLLFAPFAFVESVVWLRRERRTGTTAARGIHLAVVLVVFAYAFTPGLLVNEYLCDASYRLRFGGWLQPWAESLLAMPATDIELQPGTPYVKSALTPSARLSAGWRIPDVRVYEPYRIDDPANSMSGVNVRYIMVTWGGGFGHWGYILGPKSLRAWNFSHRRVRKVEDGVYRFED